MGLTACGGRADLGTQHQSGEACHRSRTQNQMNINAEPITSGECCLEVSFANASVSPLAKWKPWVGRLEGGQH